MTNLFLQDLIYITLDDYKNSSKSELIHNDNDEIQILISRAENKIKDLVTFEGDVPNNIKLATILLTDCLYTESIKKVKDKEIIEEKDENHTRKYQLTEKIDCMGGQVEELIKPYLKLKKTSSAAKFYRT